MPTSPNNADKALDLLLRNVHEDTFTYNVTIGKRTISKATTWSFSTPCAGVTSVQESSSTLLAARALAKAGNISLAWESIRALFSAQTFNGFLPRYRYNLTAFAVDEYYITHTTIPGPRLGSRLASLPLYASVVLDVFALSKQTEDDVQNLVTLYTSIYQYHQYMAEHRPFLSHPWESLLDVHSWIQSLAYIRRHIKAVQWKVPFDIPREVRQSFEYHPDVYEPCVYLLECIINNDTSWNESSMTGNDGCPKPPQFWSVEHTAVWIQAHQDLIEMRRVLRDRHMDWMLVDMDPTLPSQWLNNAQQQLQSLWSYEHQSFMPRQDKESMDVADASNFVALWPKNNDTNRLYSFASKLIERDMSNFSFDCGYHAIWSRGGCKEPSYISPILNFLISTGLERNELHGISYAFVDATTNKLFPNPEVATEFPFAFDAGTGLPFANMDACALYSTTTAAVVYDLSTPTPARMFHPDPPIRCSGVIVLIIVELILVFAIGASCLFLNLKMLRESSRLVREEEDREDGFFSTTGSLTGEVRYEAVVDNGDDE